LAVEVEEGARAAQFLQPGVGELIDGMELSIGSTSAIFSIL
jgi:hypothetical protein